MNIHESIKALYDETDFRDEDFNADKLFQSLKAGDDLSEIKEWAKAKGLPPSCWSVAEIKWRGHHSSKKRDQCRGGGQEAWALTFVRGLAESWGLEPQFNGLVLKNGKPHTFIAMVSTPRWTRWSPPQTSLTS